EVRVRRELGRRRLVDDLGERLAGVELSIRIAKLLERSLEVEVTGRQQAADHRHQVRHEGNRQFGNPHPALRADLPSKWGCQTGKLLKDFGEIAVPADPVRSDGVVNL